jgi:ribose transport system permease protein
MDQTDTTAAGRGSPDNGGSRRHWVRGPAAFGDWLGMLVFLALLIAAFGLKAEHFLTRQTFVTIANQVPDAVLLAIGMTFVLVVAGIDLSVGSVLALSSAVLGVSILRGHWPVWAAIVAALATGSLCGLLNGLVTVVWRLPSFIVTLGMLEIARGATYLVTRSQTQYIGAPIEGVAAVALLGLSLTFLLALALVVLGELVLTRTVFGRYMVAIGTNEEAVRLSGIDPRPVKVMVFALCGLLSGLAAVVQTSRLASADPNAGSGAELQAIAAVVVGGTSLMGGRGSVVRSLFGVLLIAVLGAGLAQIGASEPAKRVITGGLIVAAVVLDHYRQRAAKAGRWLCGDEH